ncbi:MAG: amidohydrolase family protein [Gammaproteobacteria bacterium]|nr:amidohydrolase family protein [Gammaproteobacteria bacterium]TVQ49542.1 MAG: amidohydrolase [Gammaproteobacteria bacterium]
MIRTMLLVLWLAGSSLVQAADEAWVFTDVNVVPMGTDTVLEDRHVFIRGGRIERIIEAARVSSEDFGDYRVIPAAGAYLLPGLGEMHAHIPGHAQQDFAADVLFMYLAHGVTTIRGMLGEPWHLDLREAVAAGDLPGPRIYTSGPSLNGNSVRSPEDGARMVAEQAAAGYDFLKLHPGLSREAFDAIVTAAEVHGIEFSGHVSTAVGVPRALAARQHAIDHLDGYIDAMLPRPPADVPPGFFGFNLVDLVDEGRMPGLARATRQQGVWIVPTETIMLNGLSPEPAEQLAARPEMAYLPPAMVERWVAAKQRFLGDPSYSAERAERFFELRRQLTAQLHAEGVDLLLGSDSPQFFNAPGFSIVPELEAMRAAGLTRYEALRAGTVNVARFFAADEIGQVAERHVADLVLLTGNPLEDFAPLRRPLGVMVRGEWFDRERLDAGLEEIRTRYAQATP